MKATGGGHTTRERDGHFPRERLASLARHFLCMALAPLITGCATRWTADPPSAPQGPLPLVPGPGTPRVHLQLDPPDTSYPQVELREVAGWELEQYWTSTPVSTISGTRRVPGSRGLCPVPCGVLIDGRGDHAFYFSGPGIRTSKYFQLWNESGDLLFKVSPGSQGQWRSGELVTVAGGGLSVLGGALLTGVALGDGQRNGGAGIIASGATLGLGTVLVGVGVGLLLTSRTTYSIQRIKAPLLAPR